MYAAIALLFSLGIGACLGSFAGVVADRGVRGALRGRSHCDGCGRTLAWWELVPLFSYPLLRGRCRSCHATVGWGVYRWEAGGALLGAGLAAALLAAAGSAL